ncbi:hypothetical protein [Streptomyces sp. SID14515]|uniref:hypothetical protein n=1 Tax=Streptomyces sp. SID14515 TaxID=2706074 RepID=UPI0013CA70D2|nr:hypothetical protein [Streptomyces sp. SID14515]NEB40924.1 hypothetical protein [Streptomyces sp. SID14515]NEB42094.1 hypothetical protein [Streptomyces sp. SID14515]
MNKAFRIIAVTAGAFAASVSLSTPASAQTVYTNDECSSSTRCFGIMYNSLQSGGFFRTGCFLTNKSEYSHTGYQYSPNGSSVVTVRYQFANNGITLVNGSGCDNSGLGDGVKNNAAGGSNADSRSHRVFFNTSYAGPYQTIESGNNENLSATLKNQNASSERL